MIFQFVIHNSLQERADSLFWIRLRFWTSLLLRCTAPVALLKRFSPTLIRLALLPRLIRDGRVVIIVSSWWDMPVPLGQLWLCSCTVLPSILSTLLECPGLQQGNCHFCPVWCWIVLVFFYLKLLIADMLSCWCYLQYLDNVGQSKIFFPFFVISWFMTLTLFCSFPISHAFSSSVSFARHKDSICQLWPTVFWPLGVCQESRELFSHCCIEGVTYIENGNRCLLCF